MGRQIGIIVALISVLLYSPIENGARAAKDEQSQAANKTVNVELILDASGSMAQVVDTGETRMEAAKRVLSDVITAIPERDGINVGLRVYGHKGDNTDGGQAESCASTDLLVSMKGVNKDRLLQEIEGFQPTGWTPLAHSLDEAGKDFDKGENVTNAVVMVTDGLETCGGDPCLVAGALHAANIELITHVIGFGLTDEEQEILGCIAEQGGGMLLGAGSASELSGALFTVLEQLEVVPGSGFLGGNALSILGPGEEGEIAVIATGPYDGNILPLVVRNNTDGDVIRITATASARNPSNQLIASGGDQLFHPNLVRPGEVAFGYIYFDGIDLPEDTTYDFDIDAKAATDDRFENRRDLEVVEASNIENRLVGVLKNPYDATLMGPIGTDAVCFDEQGNLLTHTGSFADQDEVGSDETLDFQINRFGGGPCPLFLVAGSGWDNTFKSQLIDAGPTPEARASAKATVTATKRSASPAEASSPLAESGETGCLPIDNAEQVLAALKGQGLPIGESETYTAETDPNELLGRPGSYTSKVNFNDTSLDPQTATFEVEDGGSIEVFGTSDQAIARDKYIRALYEANPSWTEYGFLEGPTLLRLSKRLTPDQAAEYETALNEVATCGES